MTASMPEPSSRTRSDSLDDPELPEQERKRPRLTSSKADGEEAMADAGMIPATPISATSSTESSHDRPLTPPSSTNSVDANATTSPTSKVTINTRTLHSQVSSQNMLQQTSTGADSPAQESHTAEMAPNTSNPPAKSPQLAGADAEQNEPISISSSPSRSPEIEVAEVEDYDQEPSQTKWTPVSRSTRNHFSQGYEPYYVHRTFPYVSSRCVAGQSQNIIPEIQKAFLAGHQRDGVVFQEIKNWLSDFLQRFDSLEKAFILEEVLFWREFPEIISGLIRREIEPPTEARPQDLERFFIDYGRLIVLLIKADLRQLRSYSEKTDPKEISDLFCRPYLTTLTWIMQYREIPFYDTLLKSRGYKPASMVSAVIDKLVESRGINILHFLTELLIELTGILPKKPAYAPNFFHILNAGSQFIKSISERTLQKAEPVSQASPQLEDIKENSLQFLLRADELLENAIVKQVPWLTIENSSDILRVLARSMQSLADQVESFRSEIITRAGVSLDKLDPTESLQDVAAFAWKFKTLRKYVTNGRMEIRVHGIDTMQSELVHVFNCHIRNNQSYMDVPLVRFLVKFIQETKLIDYIIGVDSHPQIIARSCNIVGFLCVTNTYTDYETDIMWKTVIESQDPRTSLGVLELFKSDFNMLELPALHYLCSKLLVLPLQRFDMRMIEFTTELLENIRQKPQRGHGMNESYDPITFELCIRLLRESSASLDCSPEQLMQIDHLGSEQLVWLVRPAWNNGPLRINEEEQNSQWQRFANDLGSNNEFATGSLKAMNAWLHGMPPDDIRYILHDFYIPKLVIDNIAYLSHQWLSGSVQETKVDVAFNNRFDLLYHIVLRVHEMVETDLLESLWNYLFTAQHLSNLIRGRAWQTLSNVVKSPQCGQNSVIDRIIADFLPRLLPYDLSQDVLEFMQLCVRYEIRNCSTSNTDEDEIVSIPGIERIWQVMLEARPGTVESNATDFLIRQFLDNDLIIKRSNSCIHATHLSLVDRCVQQVISSAAKLKSYLDGSTSGEDEPMVIIASEQEIHAEEMRFDRSLLFLRKFLEGMKVRPRYSLSSAKDTNGGLAPFEARGDPFETHVQVYNSSRLDNSSRRLTLGFSNSGSELWHYLSDVTGFNHFTTINGAKKIPLKDSLQSLKELQMTAGRLMVTKTQDTPEKAPKRAIRAMSPVDAKVMDHFQELYDLLELDERLSSEVFSFLTLFPAQSSILNLVRSKSIPADQLLPADKPYRLLYCAQALRSCMEDESFSSTPDEEFLHYGITTIIATFPRLEASGCEDVLQMKTAQSLLESLLLGFRAKASPEVSHAYINDHEAYVQHLLRMIKNGRDCEKATALHIRPQDLVREPLEVLVEGALHDERVWLCILSNPASNEVLQQILLSDPRHLVRRAVADVMLSLCGWSGAKLVLKVNDPRAAKSRFSGEILDVALANLWKCLCELLPKAVSWPFRCQELFETAVTIFRRVRKASPVSEISGYFQNWSSLLLSYPHKENIGQKVDDHVVWGFTRLLQECCKSLQADSEAVFPSDGVANALVSRFLFPELSPTGDKMNGFGMPVLSSTTREDLYELVLLLARERSELDPVVSALGDIVAKDHFFEPNLSYERQSLRSEVGYAGLRNLSNTCYLNSLFSQLFMNLQFRDFLLRTNIVDESKQRLIAQLAKVFAHMQNSYERYIDPTLAVEAIAIPGIQGQDEQIDVSVQMDVDEFYNILFDQIERQILDPEMRKRYKSLYGGQLVQQVKSKECEHISERVEPFSNIQIEIKGKRGLEDGLKAYVEGEVLQGDNKYSCTSCGKHVDAVKRACLKDVPDNLIFNLKRFDYDIMTGMRCKINDEFNFPDTIDMAPYTVEYLSNPEQVNFSDNFELTGVIVHAGTAETGHYYSYIRQRPSSKDKADSWVQFNDIDVTVFDPATIKENCYGGVDLGSTFQWPKIFSAYMLFYQRTSSIKKFERKYPQHDMLNPVRLPLSGELESHLRQQNELFIRCYCAQDPSHAKFIRLILERIQVGPDSHCEEDHVFESKVLLVVLDYIQQVSSRWKEQPEFDSTVKILKSNANRCTGCAQTILDWYVREEIVVVSMLRSPYPIVRKSFVALLVQALVRVSKAARESRMELAAQNTYSTFARDYERTFQELTTQVIDLWDDFQRFGRAWNDYFDLLTSMVKLGQDEACTVLASKGLELVLDLALVHHGTNNKRLKTKYQLYLTLREKNRPFGLSSFIECLEALLQWLDLRRISDDDVRDHDEGIFGVTTYEAAQLGLTGPTVRGTPEFEWLKKLIIGRQNMLATHRILRHLIRDTSLNKFVSRVLETGLADEQISNAVSFLEPAVLFCSHSTMLVFIRSLLKCSLEGIDTIGFQYGQEHLEYILALLKLENEDLGLGSDFFEREILLTVGSWAPVLLLYPSNDLHHDVRRETVGVLRYLIFNPLAEAPDAPETGNMRRAVRNLAWCGAQFVLKNYIDAPPKDRVTLAAGQASVFFEVMELSLTLMDPTNAQEEQRIAVIGEAMDALRLKAEAAVELLSTSWADGESDEVDLGSEYDQSDKNSP